jgi:hypothetical protein
MSKWKGIVARGFTAESLPDYLETVEMNAWHPLFVVLHNTFAPRLDQWHSVPIADRMQNLQHYYRDELKWSAGPHLFVADDLIWVFTPLKVPGVHSPSWNGVSWGVEVVGDYDSESFGTGVQRNTLAALAALHQWGGLNPDLLRLHKEDPKTTHKNCPGKNIVKEQVVSELKALLATPVTS